MSTLSPQAQALEDSLVLQGELLDDWVGVGARIGALEAERVELLARRLDLLAHERLDGDEMAFRSMCAEYAAAGHVSPSTFAQQISAAWMLARTLPATFEALASGTISKRHADVIVAAAPNVSGYEAGSVRAEYEERVVPFAQRETAARTRAAAREVAAAVFPLGTTEQHRRARGERAVTVKADGDGMAVLIAILPEVLAYAIHDRLTRMSNQVIQARPEGQRRPRRSTLEKIRAEREAALAQQKPTGPPPPDALDDALLRRLEREFDQAPPWEETTDASRTSDADPASAPDDAHATAADAAPGNVSGDVSDAASAALPAHIDGAYIEQFDREQADQSAPIGRRDDLDDRSTVFHESTPMHDGYGPLEHDTRTLDQLRADILADLLLTTAPTSVTETSLESIKATVQVTIPASALTNSGSSTGNSTGSDTSGSGGDLLTLLDGHGPMTTDAALTLAGNATSWDRLFLTPQGMVTRTDNYVPTAGMKRFLRARDQHCRFPGCRAPAHRCQIDHNHDHAQGGPTALCNLSLFCTSHHPLKHPDVDDRDRWTAKQLDDGVILWTSPLGRTYTDEPPLRVMFT
ncbi:DUF222 domain-containing protein [Microbacterium sp. YMB-B2]|uniref:DUF222 domain-containing protein n=1 Tax=Microbacterium tenebrionis TaxID=2830665 RepID=A0A9X1LN88_9MICO|nr:HNH endonuclease signature motif containing protein [Microbacterium tenebrionis]MCC2028731.1 DUF222 domain-containing protein [Microbacterium tenebrionis]